MGNNAFLGLLLVGAVVLGAIGGYLVFLGIYQEQFSQQDRITLENFETVSGVITGTISDIRENSITVLRKNLSYPIELTEKTRILVPDETVETGAQGAMGGEFVQEGTKEDLSKGAFVQVSTLFVDGTFQALRITVGPPF